MTTYGLSIGGEDSHVASGETFDSIDPTRGRVWAQYALAGQVGASGASCPKTCRIPT